MKRSFCRSNLFLSVMIFSLMLFIGACGGSNSPADSLNQQRIYKTSYYDAVNTPDGYNTYAYDGNNRLITDAYYDASDAPQGFTEYVYDGNGRLEGASFFDNGSMLLSYAEYIYNDGLLVGVNFYDASNNELFYYTFDYDGSGKLIAGYYYDSSDVLQVSWTYEYDDDSGLLTRISFYSGDPEPGSLYWYETLEYDGSGRLITRSGYQVSDGSEALWGQSVYSYNADGHLINISYYDGSGTLTGYTIVENEAGTGNYNPADPLSIFNNLFSFS